MTTGTPQLRPPQHRVSRSAIGYWTLSALVRGAIAVMIVMAVLMSAGVPGWARAAGIAVVAIAAIAFVVVMPRWRYAVHRWEATDEAVYTQTGWFDQERRIAPITRIQTVDSARGPLEQLFGLSTVTVTTASAKGPLRIAGLDVATADGLVDALTAAAQASAGDAT